MFRYLLPIILLIVSNIFMTFAWYGHLKLQQMKVVTSNTPLIIIIMLSWGLALLEYTFMIPANKLGFSGNGGPYSLIQLKVIQEVLSLTIFTLFVMVLFNGESLHWNHFVAFIFLILAVFFCFLK